MMVSRRLHLTTSQAAELAGMTQVTFRKLASRARAEGFELQLPRDEWPDARSPIYSRAAVLRYLKQRARG